MHSNNPVERKWFEAEIAPHETALRVWLQQRFPAIDHLDDIIQDAYIRVVSRHRIKPIDYPKAFLFATSRNLVIDFLRKKKIVSFENLREIDLETVLRSDEDEIQKQIHRLEQEVIIWEAINHLPKKCRRIFILRKINGLSLLEISRELGLSVKTVEVQISIGIKKCKKFFESYEEGDVR